MIGLIGSRTNIEREQHRKAGIFYALYLLNAAGLLGIVATGDAFNLYVLLEIAALSGYALIAMGDQRGAPGLGSTIFSWAPSGPPSTF